MFFSQLHGATSSKSVHVSRAHAAVIRCLQMTGRRRGDLLGPHSGVHAVTAAQQWPGAVPGLPPLGEKESEARHHTPRIYYLTGPTGPPRARLPQSKQEARPGAEQPLMGPLQEGGNVPTQVL